MLNEKPKFYVYDRLKNGQMGPFLRSVRAKNEKVAYREAVKYYCNSDLIVLDHWAGANLSEKT